jgi:predicted alpha/beta-fold hydrolase
LDRIQRPTVILTSADDPFVPAISYREARTSASVHLHIEPVGGHMGYLSREKTPLGTKRWQDYAVDQTLLWFDL